MNEKKIASYYLSKEVIDSITNLSESEGRSKSTIIERAIKLYMERGEE